MHSLCSLLQAPLQIEMLDSQLGVLLRVATPVILSPPSAMSSNEMYGTALEEIEIIKKGKSTKASHTNKKSNSNSNNNKRISSPQ